MALIANSTYAYVDLNDVQVFVGTDDLIDRGDWSSAATYDVGQAVLYLGALYYCLAANSNTPPSGNVSEEWSTLALIRQGNPTTVYIVDGTRVILDYHVAWGTNAFNHEISAVNVPYSGSAYHNVQTAIDALFAQSGTSGIDTEIANRVAGDLTVAQQGSSYTFGLYVAGTNYANSLSQSGAGTLIAQNGSQFSVILRDQGTNYTNLISQNGSQFSVILRDQGTNYSNAQDLVVAQQGSQFSTILRDQGTNYANAQDVITAQQGSQYSTVLRDQGTNYTNSQVSVETVARVAGDLLVEQRGSQYSTILRDQGTNYTNVTITAETASRISGDLTVAQHGSELAYDLYWAGTNFTLAQGSPLVATQQGSQFSTILRDQGTNYTNSQDLIIARQGSQFSTILRDQGTTYSNAQDLIIAQQGSNYAFALYVAGSNYAASLSQAGAGSLIAQNGSQYATILRDQGTNFTVSQVAIEASSRAAADLLVERHGSELAFDLYWQGTNNTTSIQLSDAGVTNDGAGLSTARVGNNLPVKRVKAGTNIAIENNGTNIKIGIDTFNTTQSTFRGPSVGEAGVSAYAGTVFMDFGSQAYSTITLAGNLYIIPTGMQAGRGVSARLIGDTVDRSLDFAGGVRFIGTRPTTLAANKIAVVSFSSYSNDLSNVVGAYSAET